MNWLARLEVDAQIALEQGIGDSYAWHKKLWDCFPDNPDLRRNFLTRIDPIEGAFLIWVLAKIKPVRPKWCPPGCFRLKEIAPSFLTHRYYAFDLRANPVKKIVQRGPNGQALYRPNGKRKTGKRVPLVKEDELRAWLIRKGRVRCRTQNAEGVLVDIPGGFRIVEEKPLEITPMVESHFRKKDKHTNEAYAAYHGGVRFRGILEVTDREAFIQTYQSGIGSAKGFGFGLLLLAPVNL